MKMERKRKQTDNNQKTFLKAFPFQGPLSQFMSSHVRMNEQHAVLTFCYFMKSVTFELIIDVWLKGKKSDLKR